ncbi:MAG: DNA topoisomerase 4 subunit A [Nitrospinae bacterium]|nr:DNA topoisomerase 4 subunit A [Nitrospinota bacterium]
MAKEKASDLQRELEDRFLTYALSTIVSRSLPDVRDGLKPIHRRILYAMDGIGLSGTAKPVKSAKIIGEVLGKYHPHGDASTYESMVRMAQDFAMRYPLVDGKGNFGSIDGDSPAAYRYTEGRLTPLTAYILNDLKKDTVEFRSNYDNTLKEPCVLPSRVPCLLINGSSGIAVGMACSFPSHNLSEVMAALTALIDDPDTTVAQLMKHIKGPDFPGGGIILSSKAEIQKAYEQGSGAVKVRGEWEIEELARGKKQIIIRAIPYGVNKARLIEKIAEIIIGKRLPPLLDVRDESDENMRVVLEVKTGAEIDKVMTYLIRHTELEINIQLNFNCLKPNGEPARLSLKEICHYFLDFRKEVVTRRLKYDLALLEKRLHLLKGFAAIFKGLDKALKLIRSSKSKQEAHEKLKNGFKLDDEQVSAVLEIPLYRLVSMEVGKIIAEQKEKSKEKKRIADILRSSKKIWSEVREELTEIDEKFGDRRRTKIKTIELVEYNAEDFIEHEDAYLVISRNGWLRKLKNLSDPTSLKYKENDGFMMAAKANTRELVAFFTSRGMVYVQKMYNLSYSRAGFGEPIQSLFKFADGEKVVHMLSLDPAELATAVGQAFPGKKASGKTSSRQQRLSFADGAEGGLEGLVVGSSGYGFRFPLTNLSETTRSGRKLMSIKNDDRMVGFSLVTGDHLFMASSNGKGLVIPVDQVSLLTGAGMGSRLMKLVNSTLVGFKVTRRKDKAMLVFEEGKPKEISLGKVRLCNRGGQGVIVSKRKKVIAVE